MKVGDLVQKAKGYNPKGRKFIGIVIGFVKGRTGLENATVWSCDGEVENWLHSFCEVISEGR